MTTKTLYCEAGDHNWERPAQKGRAPRNCPEHQEQKLIVKSKSEPKSEPRQKKSGNLTGLQKAQQQQKAKRNEKEKEWAEKVEAVINDPRMTYSTPAWGDARGCTVAKLQYIQNQLQFNRHNREPNELADLERMRERIMKNPFSRSGHLL